MDYLGLLLIISVILNLIYFFAIKSIRKEKESAETLYKQIVDDRDSLSKLNSSLQSKNEVLSKYQGILDVESKINEMLMDANQKAKQLIKEAFDERDDAIRFNIKFKEEAIQIVKDAENKAIIIINDANVKVLFKPRKK